MKVGWNSESAKETFLEAVCKLFHLHSPLVTGGSGLLKNCS